MCSQPCTRTYARANTYTHQNPTPRCVLIFPAGAEPAKCPGTSLRETLCLSQCTEVTSLSLKLESLEQCEPYSDRTLTSLAQKVQLLQKLASEEISLVTAAANVYHISTYRITQVTILHECVSHGRWNFQSQALFRADQRKLRGNICYGRSLLRFCPFVHTASRASKWLLHNLWHRDL